MGFGDMQYQTNDQTEQMIRRNMSMFPQRFIKMFETAQANPEAITKIKPKKLVVSYLSTARKPMPKKAIKMPIFCHAVGISRNIKIDNNIVKTA